jgi:hypothetical protein
MKVFQQRLVVDDVRHGKIGFTRAGGQDVVAITSTLTKPIDVTTLFPVAAIPRLIELLQNAYDTKTKEHETDVYKFNKL